MCSEGQVWADYPSLLQEVLDKKVALGGQDRMALGSLVSLGWGLWLLEGKKAGGWDDWVVRWLVGWLHGSRHQHWGLETPRQGTQETGRGGRCVWKGGTFILLPESLGGVERVDGVQCFQHNLGNCWYRL